MFIPESAKANAKGTRGHRGSARHQASFSESWELHITTPWDACDVDVTLIPWPVTGFQKVSKHWNEKYWLFDSCNLAPQASWKSKAATKPSDWGYLRVRTAKMAGSMASKPMHTIHYNPKFCIELEAGGGENRTTAISHWCELQYPWSILWRMYTPRRRTVFHKLHDECLCARPQKAIENDRKLETTLVQKLQEHLQSRHPLYDPLSCRGMPGPPWAGAIVHCCTLIGALYHHACPPWCHERLQINKTEVTALLPHNLRHLSCSLSPVQTGTFAGLAQHPIDQSLHVFAAGTILYSKPQ